MSSVVSVILLTYIAQVTPQRQPWLSSHPLSTHSSLGGLRPNALHRDRPLSQPSLDHSSLLQAERHSLFSPVWNTGSPRSSLLNHGSFTLHAASGVVPETANGVAVYKIEDDQCSQAMVDKKLEMGLKFMKFSKGTCAEQGFTQAHGTSTVGVPMVGDISVNLFAKELASEAFEKIFGNTLLEKKGDKTQKISTRFGLAGKENVAIYFTAKWCRPCKHFMPQLRKAYLDNLKPKGMEIVFVSLDHKEDDFDFYYEQMPWLALPYKDRTQEMALVQAFEVKGIPRLVIYDKDGNVTTSNGKSICDYDPYGEQYPGGVWKNAPDNIATADSLIKIRLVALSNAISSLHGALICLFVGSGVAFAVLRFLRARNSASNALRQSLLID